LLGLDFKDSQPDKLVVDYLKLMGADIEVAEDKVTIRGSQLKGVNLDMNQTPDALPAIAVTASFAQGETKLMNVAQARLKETDRIKCMADELTKLGINVEELADGLIIRGGQARPSMLDGRHDHRIVMAMSLAGMAVDGESIIDTAEAMNVTFPNYVELMKSIGANINID